jgi:putative ATP-binding cassette transporter
MLKGNHLILVNKSWTDVMNNSVQNTKTSIFSLLYRHSPKLLVLSVFIGALSGALYSLIIPMAIFGIQSHDVQLMGNSQEVFSTLLQENPAMIFFSLVLVILLTKAMSVILVNNIAKSATGNLKIRIAKKINKMKIDEVERIGFPKLLNILSDDVNFVSNAALAIPMIIVSFVTILGMLAYLAVLDLAVFTIVISAIILGVFIFQAPVNLVENLYEKARDLKDTIQEGIRGLIFGAYELKLNEKKAEKYIEEELIKPQHKAIYLEKIGDAIIHLAGTSSDLLSFFIIGMIVFILPNYIQFTGTESYGIVMALLYISAPIAAILGMFQQVKKGQVALKRINAIDKIEQEGYKTHRNLETKWQEYRAKDISYQYPNNEQESSFSLRPVTLTFLPSSINFIVGGNGSGKSTLSKLLSLHYIPSHGSMFFDSCEINTKNIIQARERISVIYSDYYLFRKLYRPHNCFDEIKVNQYLQLLNLTGKTEFRDGCFTTTKLSDGQRRRLALLVALLEDKDIYIFDEWAADQDPEFKSIFYQKILPAIKHDNKLVIVITHDDRYFDCADRVIHMEDGAVVKDVLQKHSQSTLLHENDFLSDAIQAKTPELVE